MVTTYKNALTGILYEDDSQINSMTVEKIYITDRQIPGVMIIVTKE
jgi:Holliday junction resolvase RusA-like endonuclease